MLNTKWKDMTRDEKKQHFILRLSERYDVSISGNEYDDLCNWIDTTNQTRGSCKYLLKVSRNLRAYSVVIQGQNVLALYSKDLNMFTTALPAENYYDPARMVPKIFRKKKMVEAGVAEYNKVLETCCREYIDLGDERKNWEYYSKKCAYPKLMFAEHKNGMTVRDVYRQVIYNMKDALGIEEYKIRFLV